VAESNPKRAVFHVIPASAVANTHLGSYKDIASRVEHLQNASDYQRVLLDADDADPVLAAARNATRPAFLIEYSKFPKLLRRLRAEYPRAFIAVRAHNIEPLQHLDNVGWWPRKGPVWTAYGMARLAWSDVVCKRHADAIYSINEWENRAYWERLPGSARIEWLPYHCPRHLLPTIRIEPASRNRIVCLPTSQRSRKSLDLVERFHRFAEAVDAVRPGAYEFLVTGDLDSWELPDSKILTRTGMVDDLRDVLGAARAVCMLSPLGYGFKTTIGDAVAHGCIPIVHPALRNRLPREFAGAVIDCDSEVPGSVDSVLRRLDLESAHQELDGEMRLRAERMLDRDLELDSTT
jgi:hypothetical protein